MVGDGTSTKTYYVRFAFSLMRTSNLRMKDALHLYFWQY